MKKKILLLMGIFSLGVLNAQVGINTRNPQGTFHIDGRSSVATTNPDAGLPNLIQQSDDVVILANGNVGLGVTNPTSKLVIEDGATVAAPKPVAKFVDANVKKGRVMTAVDATGRATWRDYEYEGMVGQVYKTDSLPAQYFLKPVKHDSQRTGKYFIKKNATDNWSFKIEQVGYYAVEIRWWVRYNPEPTPKVITTATHFYLNIDSETIDQYETYNTITTSVENRLTCFATLYYDAGPTAINKVLYLEVRPGRFPTEKMPLPPTASALEILKSESSQWTELEPSTPWTTSKITVKRMDI